MEAVRRFSGAQLRTWRLRRGLSLDAVAAGVGTTRPNVIAYEQGRRKPSPATVLALAATLKVAPHELAEVPRKEWTVADVRAFSGWTKAEAAEALGVARATYDAMEAGRRTFRADLLDRLAEVLGCRPSVVRGAHRRGQGG